MVTGIGIILWVVGALMASYFEFKLSKFSKVMYSAFGVIGMAGLVMIISGLLMTIFKYAV